MDRYRNLHFASQTPIIGTRYLCDHFIPCGVYFYFIYFISFAKENKTFNVTKLKKGVGKDTATAEANYSWPITVYSHKTQVSAQVILESKAQHWI